MVPLQPQLPTSINQIKGHTSIWLPNPGYWKRRFIRGKAKTKYFATISAWCYWTHKISVVFPPSKKIHSIIFNPKEEWQSVRVLSGWDTVVQFTWGLSSYEYKMLGSYFFYLDSDIKTSWQSTFGLRLFWVSFLLYGKPVSEVTLSIN